MLLNLVTVHRCTDCMMHTSSTHRSARCSRSPIGTMLGVRISSSIASTTPIRSSKSHTPTPSAFSRPLSDLAASPPLPPSSPVAPRALAATGDGASFLRRFLFQPAFPFSSGALALFSKRADAEFNDVAVVVFFVCLEGGVRQKAMASRTETRTSV